jgi:hypothetical protein
MAATAQQMVVRDYGLEPMVRATEETYARVLG